LGFKDSSFTSYNVQMGWVSGSVSTKEFDPKLSRAKEARFKSDPNKNWIQFLRFEFKINFRSG